MDATNPKGRSLARSMGATADQVELLSEGSAVYREYLTAQAVSAHVTAQALRLGETDYFALNLISLAGSMTAGELAARTGLSTGAATRLIDRLQESGYVRRIADPTDRRKVVVAKNDDRQAELDRALDPFRHGMVELFTSYPPAELKVLLDYFARATVALRAITDKALEQ